MKLESIECFLALSRRLNFTKASAELYIAQPSLSRNIIQLEDELGGQLFHRNRHAVSLTTLGGSFLPYAQEIKDAHDKAAAFITAVKRDPKKMQREVRIGLAVYQLTNFLPAFISHMSGVMPNLSFFVTDGLQGDILTQLREGKLDIIFTAGHSLQNTAGITVLPFSSAPMKLTITSSHKLASAAEPVSVSAINSCALPLFTLEPSLREHLKLSFPNLQIKQMHSLTRCLTLIEAGLGIAIFPSEIQHVAPQTVKFVEIADYPLSLDVVVAWKQTERAFWWDTFLVETSSFIESYCYHDSPGQS